MAEILKVDVNHLRTNKAAAWLINAKEYDYGDGTAALPSRLQQKLVGPGLSMETTELAASAKGSEMRFGAARFLSIY